MIEKQRGDRSANHSGRHSRQSMSSSRGRRVEQVLPEPPQEQARQPTFEQKKNAQNELRQYLDDYPIRSARDIFNQQSGKSITRKHTILQTIHPEFTNQTSRQIERVFLESGILENNTELKELLNVTERGIKHYDFLQERSIFISNQKSVLYKKIIENQKETILLVKKNMERYLFDQDKQMKEKFQTQMTKQQELLNRLNSLDQELQATKRNEEALKSKARLQEQKITYLSGQLRARVNELTNVENQFLSRQQQLKNLLRNAQNKISAQDDEITSLREALNRKSQEERNLKEKLHQSENKEAELLQKIRKLNDILKKTLPRHSVTLKKMEQGFS